MVNQTCVWWTDLCLSGPVWQPFGERAFAKFCDKNVVFVNFCDKTLYMVALVGYLVPV